MDERGAGFFFFCVVNGRLLSSFLACIEDEDTESINFLCCCQRNKEKGIA